MILTLLRVYVVILSVMTLTLLRAIVVSEVQTANCAFLDSCLDSCLCSLNVL